MKAHNYTPKVNCPSCRRDVNANNDGALDPHYDQRVGKLCPGKIEFDISDGRNRYLPCPGCGSDHGMGLISVKRALAVQCILCDFRGPAFSDPPSAATDKKAFDGWNALPRAPQLLQTCPSCGKRVTVEQWADFEGVCAGCAEAIRELPA